MDKKNLFIVDGSSYEFRAYFASPPMSNTKGFPTNALYTFTRMLLALMRTHKPDAIIVTFDAPGKKFRHELYPDYKAKRPPVPDAFSVQFPWFPRIVEALGIPCYSLNHYEADDVIATLAKKAAKDNWLVTIISGDKDLMQLLKDGDIQMMDTMAKPPKLFHEAQVLERFQVEPNRVTDVLALAGDAVDNIPGAQGIGEKTAGNLIVEYGSLENLIQNANNIKAKARREKILAFAPNAKLYKTLVTLVDNIDLEVKYGGFAPIPEQIIDIFNELGFLNLIPEILPHFSRNSILEILKRNASSTQQDPNPKIPPKPQAKTKSQTTRTLFDNLEDTTYEKNKQELQKNIKTDFEDNSDTNARTITWQKTKIILQKTELDAIANAWQQTHAVALHPVWENLKPTDATLVGISCFFNQNSYYIPLNHRDIIDIPDFNADYIFKHLQPLLQNPKILKCIDDFKPFVQYLNRIQSPFDATSFLDTKLATYLWHSTEGTSDYVRRIQVVLGNIPDLITENEYLGKGKSASLPADISVARTAQVIGQWCQADYKMSMVLRKKLQEHEIDELYASLELPLCVMLAEMEATGVNIDKAYLSQLRSEFETMLQELQKKIEAEASCSFNIQSPKQVAEILYEKLGYQPKIKKSRAQGVSTDQETLESLAEQGPLPALILEYRSVAKMLTTYVDALKELVNPKTNRVHGLYNQCVTITGRLSSSEPNMQNIPSRNKYGTIIRRAFIPAEGCVLIGADYSQIELRVMAHFAKDPIMIQAFKAGEDIHARTASKIYDVPMENVTKEQRSIAKTINFGILYGMGPQKLAREIHVPPAEAKIFIKKFREQFTTFDEFFNSLISQAAKKGYVSTILKRRRYTPEIHSENQMHRAFAERTAINSPIQGSASDLMKLAMVQLRETLLKENLHAKVIIQVHDEVILECPESEQKQTLALLKNAMENVYPLDVQLKVDMKVGKTWGDMQKIRE